MLHRERLNPPRYIYQIDEWKLSEKRFYPELLGQMETLFALSNGYLGMRGTFEEGIPSIDPGNFVNGFYETWPIIYGEEAFGFQTRSSRMKLACGVDHNVVTAIPVTVKSDTSDSGGKIVFAIDAQPEAPVRITK